MIKQVLLIVIIINVCFILKMRLFGDNYCINCPTTSHIVVQELLENLLVPTSNDVMTFILLNIYS